MMSDPGLSALDRQWVVNFQIAVDDFLAKRGGYTPEFSMFNIASSIGLDVSGLHKEGTLLYALWITILNSLQKYITAKDFKYASIDDFLAAYPGQFQNESDYEKRYLWLTANWMNILFRMITARKNKGLVLYVVPKLIEGWDAKYVTGSGQTKATANRVHIFENEGNVKANQRGKAKAGKKKPSQSAEGASPRAPSVPKPKKRKLDPVVYEDIASNFAFTQPFGSVAHYREQRQAAAAPGPMPLRSRRSEGLVVDKEDYPLNEDVHTTFSAWQEATENYGLGLLNLSRSNSYMANGLAKNVDQQLTDPLDYQRGFSWTEIPVAPAPLSTANASSASTYNTQPINDMYSTAPNGNLNMSGLYNSNGLNANVNVNGTLNGGLPVLPASAMPTMFPPPEDPLASGMGATSNVGDNNIGSGSSGGGDHGNKLNLEVGSIVPVSGLMDIFQGYK